jgi:hypothetical protein
MMRLRFLIVLLFWFTNTSGQDQPKRWGIEAGVGFRSNPVSLEDKGTTHYRDVAFNSIKQFKTQNLFLSFKGEVYQKFTAEISSYFRYCHNHYVRREDLTRGEVEKLKADFFLNLLYKITAGNNLSFFVGAGWGMMNVNSGYNFNQTIAIDTSGRPVKRHVAGNFQFTAPSILFRAQYGRLNAGLTIYATPDDNYDPYISIWPELRLGYSFIK